VIIDPQQPAAVVPLAKLFRVSVGVSGAGTVKGSAGIVCGIGGSSCAGTVKPGSTVTLKEVPVRGFVFGGWTGGCAGKGPACGLKVNQVTSVAARFEPVKTSTAAVSIDKAIFSVHWHESVASGKLVLKGRIGKSSQVDVKLSRARGSELVGEHLGLSAGPFDLALNLEPSLLAGGAQLFPGGFVVSVSGRSGNVAFPPEVTAVTLLAPPEGVVSHAYASATSTGRPTATLARGSRQAFVQFDFQAQPASSLPVSVAWYAPNGRLLGVKDKPNRATVTTSIGSSGPLPSGTWRVDLRAGKTLVEQLAFGVG
jgi:hypothetical protein